jgi:two-component system, LytTR family, response regulator
VNKIKAILVDDEESARDVLENLLHRFCPEVDLLKKCNNVEQAVEAIKIFQPSLVFLDIEMPNYRGYELIDFFSEINFEIIFVTAYDSYAIKAFEVSAVDYLLKPIEIDRLRESVKRVSTKFDHLFNHEKINHLKNTLKSDSLQSILVAKNGNQYVVSLKDIIAIEAQESYSCIHTLSGNYLMSKNLKYFERMLENENAFIRIHKSWIINIHFVLHYSKSELTVELKKAVVAKLSKYKKMEFEALLKH